MMTLKRAAQSALDVQSACNLSGVLRTFVEVMDTLRRECPNLGTDGYNLHPICVLYSTQIAFLTGTSSLGCERQDYYRIADEEVRRLASAADGDPDDGRLPPAEALRALEPFISRGSTP